MPEPFDPGDTFIDIAGDAATPIEVTETFWSDLMSGRVTIEGFMMARLPVTGTSEHWERHPEGEEILYLLSGTVEVVLDEGAGENRVRLDAGRALIVPRGVWHYIDAVTASEMLFLTCGMGTEHKPVSRPIER